MNKGEQQCGESADQQHVDPLHLNLQLARIGDWEWNIKTGAMRWSAQLWPLFGLEAASCQTSYHSFRQLIHPQDRASVSHILDQAASSGANFDIEHRVIHPGGHIHWLRQIGQVIINDQKHPLSIHGITIDIDHCKQTELRLRNSEKKYRALLENASDAIVLMDEQGIISDVNHTAAELLGHAGSSLIGQAFHHYCHPEQQARFAAHLDETLHASEVIAYEIHLQACRGQATIVDIRQKKINVGDEFIIQAIIRDISQRLEQEHKQQRQVEKQRHTLIREVHHRIKNNLQGITGLLHNNLESAGREAGQMISKAIDQINSIAIVHGIQCQHDTMALLLCEMLPAIIDSATLYGEYPVKIRLHMDIIHSLVIQEKEAVPIALILNELIVNAQKHTPRHATSDNIDISLHAENNRASITIWCPDSRLADDFDFHQNSGLGTGLELVGALLPKQGLSIHYRQMPNGVSNQILIEAPVVHNYLLHNDEQNTLHS